MEIHGLKVIDMEKAKTCHYFKKCWFCNQLPNCQVGNFVLFGGE